MKLLEEIRRDIEGVKLLNDWLGEGTEPVGRQEAEHRAEICLGCPFHQPIKWWEQAKHAVAEVIKAELELKHHLDLKVPQEEAMGMCEVCRCCCRLKIWTPSKHLEECTSPEVAKKLPSWCWILKKAVV